MTFVIILYYLILPKNQYNYIYIIIFLKYYYFKKIFIYLILYLFNKELFSICKIIKIV